MIRIVQKRHIRDKTYFLSVEIEITQTFFTYSLMEKPCCSILFVAMYVHVLKSIICNCKLVFLSAVYTTVFAQNSLCNEIILDF